MKSITKYELATAYGISLSKLRTLMNVDFLEELMTVGYSVTSKIVSPKVIEKFVELYGEPKDFLNL